MSEKYLMNKDSWSYSLVKFHVETSIGYYPKDFCTYWRYAVYGAFKIVFAVTIMLLLVGVLLIPFYFLAVILYENMYHGGVYLISFIAFVVSAYYAVRFIYRKITTSQFISTKYRAWKEKYCPILEYRDS